MIKELATGLGVTLENLFKKPFTVQYPEEKLEMFPRFRGLHILTRHADGLERCVGCELCAVACPADAIFVKAAENDPANPVSHGERYAERYEINMLRCIFCGMCEEACPEDAIYLEKDYELSDYNRDAFIYTKDDWWCRWRSPATCPSARAGRGSSGRVSPKPRARRSPGRRRRAARGAGRR
jgi:NADH-quinone oxidoreductase subunit I